MTVSEVSSLLEQHVQALFTRGMEADMSVSAPLPIPEEPMPAMALPTMNILEEVATAQINEPNSKSRIKDM